MTDEKRFHRILLALGAFIGFSLLLIMVPIVLWVRIDFENNDTPDGRFLDAQPQEAERLAQDADEELLRLYLYSAIHTDRRDLVELLIRNGADPTRSGGRLIRPAVLSHDIERLQYVLDLGAPACLDSPNNSPQRLRARAAPADAEFRELLESALAACE